MTNILTLLQGWTLILSLPEISKRKLHHSIYFL